MGKKILVSGPESSGKTTLCTSLAERFSGLVRTEKARTYLTEAGTAYAYSANDLREIWQLQCQEEALLEKQNKLIFCDTGHFVMAVWNEKKFTAPELRLAELRKIQPIDYRCVLLCAPDIGWAPDPLREAPDQALRDELFARYEQLILAESLPCFVIRGEDRDQQAIDALASMGIELPKAL